MANLPGKPAGINNTAYFFAFLAFAFLFYVTAKGDLGKWLGLFGLAGDTGKGLSAAAASTSGTSDTGSGSGTDSNAVAGGGHTPYANSSDASVQTQPGYYKGAGQIGSAALANVFAGTSTSSGNSAQHKAAMSWLSGFSSGSSGGTSTGGSGDSGVSGGGYY